MTICLDIGGEGRHPEAWNVNTRRRKTLGPHKGAPIPYLVLARGQCLPFAQDSIDRVIVERTPLPEATVREIARVIRPGGEVQLRHVAIPGHDRHAYAKLRLGAGGRVSCRLRRQRGRDIQETRIELSHEEAEDCRL